MIHRASIKGTPACGLISGLVSISGVSKSIDCPACQALIVTVGKSVHPDETRLDVQNFRLRALNALSDNWQSLPGLREKLNTLTNPWRDLRDAGRAEERTEGTSIQYRIKGA